jgi:hypothetical protein
MSATQWLSIAAASGVLIAAVALDWRHEHRRRRRINAALAELRCRACGRAFAEWHGARSRSFYTFVDGSRVELVIDVTCAACGKHSDAFWTQDGELNVEMPW